MTLSTWQLIVVGALATIWAVVLGVPLVVDLLRWLRNRPPAPENDLVPTRHRALGRLQQLWWDRPRPYAAWKAQDVAERRFRVLLALGLATTVAMFLAIALRGVFVQLFLAMLAFSLLALAVGAFIGAAEHRTLTDQARARLPSNTKSHGGLAAGDEAPETT